MTRYELIGLRYTHWGVHRKEKFRCSTCGFVKEFTDGHTSQWVYCPTCGKNIVYVKRLTK